MDTKNQEIYNHFKQAVDRLTQNKKLVEANIVAVQEQLGQMKKELLSIDEALIRHQGIVQCIQFLSENNMAIIEYDEQQLASLNNLTAYDTPMAQARQGNGQYTPQAPGPALTPQGEKNFSPPAQFIPPQGSI